MLERVLFHWAGIRKKDLMRFIGTGKIGPSSEPNNKK
jgi:hypothetical protein